MTQEYLKDGKPVTDLDDRDSGVINSKITHEHYDSVLGSYRALGNITKDGDPSFGRKAQDAVQKFVKACHSTSEPTGGFPKEADYRMARDAKDARVEEARDNLAPYTSAMERVGLNLGLYGSTSAILNDHLFENGAGRKAEVTVSRMGFPVSERTPPAARQFANTGKRALAC